MRAIKDETTRIWCALASCGLGLVLALLWLIGARLPTEAATFAQLDVCAGCTYTTIQSAVDVAGDGDLIRVAAGVYTDVHFQAGVIQVVYISKTVTVWGGYTSAFDEPPDPAANQTLVDAQGGGRGLYVTGSASPTIAGLYVTGGNASGLGGGFSALDTGGGIYVNATGVTIDNCTIYSNVASSAASGFGGGVYISGTIATLKDNRINNNVASSSHGGGGGGMYIRHAVTTLDDNVVSSNTATTADSGGGGGIYVHGGFSTLNGNEVRGNVGSSTQFGYGGGVYVDIEAHVGKLAMSDSLIIGNSASAAGPGEGGGVSLDGGPATLSRNTIQGNTAAALDWGRGGGMLIEDSGSVTLIANKFISNTATLDPESAGEGGGLWVNRSAPLTLTNNLVVANHAKTFGSGLYFAGISSRPAMARLLHSTIADNVGSGQGVYADAYSTLSFTNSIIADHSNGGVVAATGSTVTLEATLWRGLQTMGGGHITIGTVNLFGDPAFVDPSTWNYHISDASPAVDAGIVVDVTSDIDGGRRPTGNGYDLGADELCFVYLPIILRNE